jgi:hypothetical protein
MKKAMLVLAASGLLLAFLPACDGGATEFQLLYQVYPDTDEAPVLHYYGPDPDQVTIKELGPYGVWEGSDTNPYYQPDREPATEIEIHTEEPQAYDLYSPVDGTVVYKSYENNDGEIHIRYGRRYVVSYLHVSDIPDELQPGTIVHQGDFVGTTVDGYGFWELELDRIYQSSSGFGGRPLVASLYPIDYFDEESQQVLEAIRQEAQQNSGRDQQWQGPDDDPAAGWYYYVPSHEMWADSHKSGVEGNFIGPEEYYGHYDMCFILNDTSNWP